MLTMGYDISHWFELDTFFIDRLSHSTWGHAGDRVPDLVVRALLCLLDSQFAAVGAHHHPGLIILGAGRRRRESVLALGGDLFRTGPVLTTSVGS